jgi:two-component system sensor histidine kinase/response regulator
MRINQVRKSIDAPAVLARVGSDKALLRELAGIFLQECPKTITEMREAITGEDSNSLMRIAHTLKGQAAFFGADPVCKLALRLERMGRTHKLADSQKTWAALKAEIGQLTSALTALVSEEGHEDPGCR